MADGLLVGPPYLVVFRNDGAGWTQWEPFDPGASVNDLALADLDLDGGLDIACGNDAGNIRIGRNPLATLDPFANLWGSNQAGTTGSRTWGIDAADLDRDGYMDLVTVDDRGDVDIWRNDQTPFTGGWPWKMLGTPDLATVDVAVGDLDNDGWVDVVTEGGRDAPMYLRVWRNPGDPFGAPVWTGADRRLGQQRGP